MAIVGGTASELGGGKFANGAVSGAFVHMFNGEANTLAKMAGKVMESLERIGNRIMDNFNATNNAIETQAIETLATVATIKGGNYIYQNNNKPIFYKEPYLGKLGVFSKFTSMGRIDSMIFRIAEPATIAYGAFQFGNLIGSTGVALVEEYNYLSSQ